MLSLAVLSIAPLEHHYKQTKQFCITSQFCHKVLSVTFVLNRTFHQLADITTGDENIFKLMATTFRRIQEFQPDNELFSANLERRQLFFQANNVAINKQVTVLLRVLGARHYTLLHSLLAPAKVKGTCKQTPSNLHALST